MTIQAASQVLPPACQRYLPAASATPGCTPQDRTARLLDQAMGTRAKREAAAPVGPDAIKVGHLYQGTVEAVYSFGAFVELSPSGKTGLLHISDIIGRTHGHAGEIHRHLSVGDRITVSVASHDPAWNRLVLQMPRTQYA